MEEIRIQEYILILLKRKWFIITFTIVFIIIGTTLSYLFFKPVYKSESTILLNSIDIKSGIDSHSSIIFNVNQDSMYSAKEVDNRMLGSLQNQIKYPQISIDTITKYIKSDVFMSKILKDLNLNTNVYEYDKTISISTDASADSSSGTITVSVKDMNAGFAIKIKKGIISYIPEYIQKIANVTVKETSDFLSKGLTGELKSAVEKKEKIASYGAQIGYDENNVGKLPINDQIKYQKAKTDYIFTNQTLEAYQIFNKELDSIKLIDYSKVMDIKLLKDDKTPLEPIATKKSMIIAVSMVLGIILSIILAFVMEFLKNIKEPNKIK